MSLRLSHIVVHSSGIPSRSDSFCSNVGGQAGLWRNKSRKNDGDRKIASATQKMSHCNPIRLTSEIAATDILSEDPAWRTWAPPTSDLPIHRSTTSSNTVESSVATLTLTRRAREWPRYK